MAGRREPAAGRGPEPVRERPGTLTAEDAVPEHAFALCLTHDVDRPYKTFQALYYAATERRPHHLTSLLPGMNPYWQFDEIMAGERRRGVRSAFYFLDEQRLFGDRPVREWFTVRGWRLFAGRYAIEEPRIVDVIHRLDEGGWEVGLHGSYESYRDVDRLRREKRTLEAILGRPVVGGRQHYLNLDVPETWRRHRSVGLRYDATLGSSETYGFHHGYGATRPFDDHFVQFPLTVMERSLPAVGRDTALAWRELEGLLDVAEDQAAIVTVLWHPRYFNSREFPGYARLYWRLVDAALARGAWVGPPEALYRRLVGRTSLEPPGVGVG